MAGFWRTSSFLPLLLGLRVPDPEGMSFIVLLAIFVALALAAPFCSSDSRDGRDWQPPHFR
jgi:hypothetical protein